MSVSIPQAVSTIAIASFKVEGFYGFMIPFQYRKR